MSTARDVRIVLPIVYSNIPEHIAFETPLPTQLYVTIRDNGKQLRQISRSHHELTLNIESQLTQAEGVVQISSEILRPKLQDMLPGSTVVLQVQPRSDRGGISQVGEEDRACAFAGAVECRTTIPDGGYTYSDATAGERIWEA